MSFETDYQSVLRRTTSTSAQGYTATEIDLAQPRVPEALRITFRLAGRCKINQQHNRLYPPSRLAEDSDGMVVFAEENQNVVVWGYKAADSDNNPRVYQKQFDGQDFGKWTEEGLHMDHFLICFAYWNAANGAADFSGVGEVSDTSRKLLRDYPVVWECPDFVVMGKEALFVIAGDGDFYCFGTDEREIVMVAEALQVEWFDMG